MRALPTAALQSSALINPCRPLHLKEISTMKFALCLVISGFVAGALCGAKKDPVNLNWQAPPPEPYVKAKPAVPDGGVNFKVEKTHTFYYNGNLKLQGTGAADRNVGGARDGAVNAKVGGRAQWS